jgi:hypothetical protein
MLTLFREGGYPMFFVLGFGFVALGWAAWYAATGRKRPLGFVRGMMLATLFSVASGTVSDFGAVFHAITSMKDLTADGRTAILLEGLGESMAPGILGFSLLSMTALLLAVGALRTETVDP